MKTMIYIVGSGILLSGCSVPTSIPDLTLLDTHQEKITALTQTIDKQQQTIEALQSQISGYQDLLSGMKQQFDQLTMLMNDIVEVNDLLLTGKIDTMTGKTLSGENLHGSAMTGHITDSVTYRNIKYNFALTLPSSRSGYTTKVTGSTISGVVFFHPDYEHYLFVINIYPTNIRNDLEDKKNLIIINKNEEKTFILSINPLLDLEKDKTIFEEIRSLVKTFSLINENDEKTKNDIPTQEDQLTTSQK